MPKISYVGCPGLPVVNSAQFTVEECCSQKLLKKSEKKPIFQHSRSPRVIDLDANQKLPMSDY